MQLSKNEKEQIQKILDYWVEKNLLSESKKKELEVTLQAKPFNWQSLAYYSFIFAVISLLIAVVSIFADKVLLDLIDSLISTSYVTKTFTFLVLSIFFFIVDYKYNQAKSRNKYSKEVFAFFGAVLLAIATGFCSYLFNKQGEPGLFILGLTGIYFLIAVVRQKEILWLFGITALLIAYGTITYQLGKDNNLFIGMNFPMRFTILGILILVASYFVNRIKSLKLFIEPTYWSGLLIFFFALWVLSIAGNYNSYESWLEIRQYQLWWYSITLLGASLAAIVIGLKKEDNTLKNIGVSFIFLNLYTRYFEYFWDELHKALFFGIIAISFWLIGKKAEKIWESGSL